MILILGTRSRAIIVKTPTLYEISGDDNDKDSHDDDDIDDNGIISKSRKLKLKGNGSTSNSSQSPLIIKSKTNKAIKVPATKRAEKLSPAAAKISPSSGDVFKSKRIVRST